MAAARTFHAAITLNDGSVLIAGGSVTASQGEALRSAELFNPSAKPALVIQSPADSSMVSGTVKISALGSSAVSLADLYLDGKYQSSSRSPYIFKWNSMAVPNDTYTIGAAAFDRSNQRLADTSIVLDVQNP